MTTVYVTRYDRLSAQKTESPEEMLRKNAVEIVKNMQRLRDDRGDAESVEGENRLARRRTIQNLVNQQQRRQPIGTLDVAFRKRFQQLSNNTSEGECRGIVISIKSDVALVY